MAASGALAIWIRQVYAAAAQDDFPAFFHFRQVATWHPIDDLNSGFLVAGWADEFAGFHGSIMSGLPVWPVFRAALNRLGRNFRE